MDQPCDWSTRLEGATARLRNQAITLRPCGHRRCACRRPQPRNGDHAHCGRRDRTAGKRKRAVQRRTPINTIQVRGGSGRRGQPNFGVSSSATAHAIRHSIPAPRATKRSRGRRSGHYTGKSTRCQRQQYTIAHYVSLPQSSLGPEIWPRTTVDVGPEDVALIRRLLLLLRTGNPRGLARPISKSPLAAASGIDPHQVSNLFLPALEHRPNGVGRIIRPRN